MFHLLPFFTKKLTHSRTVLEDTLLEVIQSGDLIEELRLIQTYHAVPLPCPVAKDLHCVSPI